MRLFYGINNISKIILLIACFVCFRKLDIEENFMQSEEKKKFFPGARLKVRRGIEKKKNCANFCRLLFFPLRENENFRCASLCWSKVVNNWLCCHFQSSFHRTNPRAAESKSLHWTWFYKNLIAFIASESIRFIESDEEAAVNYWTLSLEIVQAQV